MAILLTNLLMVRAIIFLKNKLCTEMNYAANIFFHIFTIAGLTVVAIVKKLFSKKLLCGLKKITMEY